MAKATQRPWRTGERNETRGVPILAGEGEDQRRVSAIYGSDSISDAEDEANAAFIVRAVNAHDALINSGNMMLTALRRLRDQYPTQWDDLVTSDLAQAWTDIVAALKLAEGE